MDKQDILEEIEFMKKGEKEELYRIGMYSITTFLKSSILFGINSNQAKESINVITNMIKILKEERTLLNIINKNIDNINIDDASIIIDMLDKVNDNTYLSYEELLNNINVCCDIKDKDRLFKSNKEIDSLINNNNYKEKVLKLIK